MAETEGCSPQYVRLSVHRHPKTGKKSCRRQPQGQNAFHLASFAGSGEQREERGKGVTRSAACRAAARPAACTSLAEICRWNSIDISPTALSSESTAFSAPRLVGLLPLFLNMLRDLSVVSVVALRP